MISARNNKICSKLDYGGFITMRSADVLRALKITRPTLTKYVKEGLIRVIHKPNGQYDYNQDDVYGLMYSGIERRTYIYASIWKDENRSERKSINEQIELLKTFCAQRGYPIAKVCSDMNCTSELSTREELVKIIDETITGTIERIVIVNKSRISQTDFELLQYILGQQHCAVEVMVTE